ncbi:MAG: type II secretion system protein GspG [Kiritimatiellae bacterium]|nr:type II secretion system protein GspG [Kiritimatiellia bacterium]
MKRAFTLVELSVVLLVLAVLAHLAVRELGRTRDRKLVSAADRQLEEVRSAVWELRPGEDPSGFLADMGRLPGISPDGTLEELWARPAGVPEYALREATGTNLCAGVSGEPGVFVPTGWRGPYLRLPAGRDGLFDPWGNPMTVLDDAGLSRLNVENGFVTAVSHYGPTGRESGKKTVSLIPDGGGSSRLVVNFLSAGASSGSVTCKWFGPCSGAVTGAVGTVAYPGTVSFEGLTPGLRVFHDSVTGGARFIVVKPGDNAMQVVVP